MDNERFIALEAHYNAILPTLATKADIESLRSDMNRMIAETHKWMVGSLIGLFIGFGGLGYSLAQVLRQPAAAPLIAQPLAAAAQQPIVIYLTPPPQQAQPQK